MYALAIFLPLIAAVLAGFGGRWLGDRGSQFVTCGAMLLSAAISCLILFEVAFGGRPQTVELFPWIASGAFEASWTLRFDQLTAVMAFVVTVVSAMVHVYSVGYMSHDRHIPRFMAYLSLFTFFMLVLVTADNLLQLFFGWEGVGLCSYLLIGFWYDKPEANAAAIKAFIVNRIGDFGFALGIMGVFLVFNSISFDAIFAAAAGKADATIGFLGYETHALTALCILLFVGAMGKSAQLGLHTWLPDAMEGPTPVSALIHAATMVTAGVFMVARLSPLFEHAPVALDAVAVVGATTALFAATVALCQNDIKRVIAYSTCSQLGYMFFACGVSAYSAGIFHLTTHAFFKALLFLGAGSVIHAMSAEQDMRKMGGIWRMIPATYVLMWVGSLALAGVPFLAGYYSKDLIIEAAFGAHTAVGHYAFWAGVIAALLTAFYSWRLIFLTFHGESRADETTLAHVHESPQVMLIPLLVLALGAALSGFLGYESFTGGAAFWGESIFVMPGTDPIAAAHHAPFWVKALPVAAALLGILAAWHAYMRDPELPARAARRFGRVYRFLLNKWYFDELYDCLFVRPAHRFGRNLWKEGDGAIIDGLGPDGVAAVARHLARRVAALQSGYLYHYAFAMLAGVAGVLTWYLLTRG